MAEKQTLGKDQSHETGSCEEKPMKQLGYRGLVGSISYLVQTIRPELAFSAIPVYQAVISGVEIFEVVTSLGYIGQLWRSRKIHDGCVSGGCEKVSHKRM